MGLILVVSIVASYIWDLGGLRSRCAGMAVGKFRPPNVLVLGENYPNALNGFST